MRYLHSKPGGLLHGTLPIPGDKSITQRALIIGAIAKAHCNIELENWLPGLDCLSTMQALQDLGVTFHALPNGILQIKSVGLHGLQDPGKTLNVGNSGTAIRLLTGILSAQKFSSVITGDASICQRPMQRIVIPLMQMGAQISARNDAYAPLSITGGQQLRAINYVMPMASAQVKSAILLASLYADGKSNVTAPNVCRDHTEIMLNYFAQQPSSAQEIALFIPGDLSSAAFFMVGACITPGAEVLLPNVGINPTRSGIFEILRNMGAEIRIENVRIANGEQFADLHVRYTQPLRGITVPQNLIANAIDELPILCVAAACAHGTTVIRGAEELRYKESDRIARMAQGLKQLGVTVNEFSDGLAITGGVISGGEVDAAGDHRIAMAFTLAGLSAKNDVIVGDTENIATSFPDFVAVARNAGMLLTEET